MIVQSYIRYLTYEKRFSEHTITAYKTDLAQFQGYLLEQFDVDDILTARSTYIRSWLVEMMQQGTEVRSIQRKRSTLNSFFNFAIRQEKIEVNPMEQVSVPKFQKKLPGYLRLSELEMLESALPEALDYSSARDRLIIEMLYSTGMRRSELIHLKLSDVDLRDRTLRVLGKRRKVRIIPITNSLSASLSIYFGFRDEMETDSHLVFLTDKLKPLYPKFVYNVVNRYLSMVTAADSMGPHSLRHTFATLMLDSGADLNAIKELLGHADLNATQVYTHTSIEKLKQAYSTAHPRAEKS